MLALVRLYLISQTWIRATLFFLIVKGVPLFSGCYLISTSAAAADENWLDSRTPPGVFGTAAWSPSVSHYLPVIGLVLSILTDYWRSRAFRKSTKIDPPSTSRMVSGWPMSVTGLLMNNEWNL